MYQYPEPTQPQPTPPPRRRRRWPWVVALAFGAFLALVIGLSAGSSSSRPLPVVTPVTSTAAPVSPAAAPAPAPANTAPAMTDGQAQAVQSAQGYLSDGQGFSKAGLQDQLTSSYGEGFTPADAAFAISYLHPDWNAQAVESAQGYMADGQGFSRTGLLQQLTSSYGEGFTEAQAEYAVAKVGL